jgi:hypothetical protein
VTRRRKKMVRWTWRGVMAALQDVVGAVASSAADALAVASCVRADDLARPLYRPCLRQRVPAVERASAPYLLVDSPAVAPIRARLRLCETSLDEHLVLRHRSSTGVVSPTGCRACGAAPETVDHVYLHCPVFNVPRSAASDALGVLGARLDRAAIAAVSPVGLVGDDLCARVALATADLLLAVRASPRLRPAR